MIEDRIREILEHHARTNSNLGSEATIDMIMHGIMEIIEPIIEHEERSRLGNEALTKIVDELYRG